MATVVSNSAPERFILDAGSKVLSEATSSTGEHGLISSIPGAKLVRLGEEHGVVLAEPGSLRLGQRVEIIPVHVCTAVNLSKGYYLKQEKGELLTCLLMLGGLSGKEVGSYHCPLRL